MLMMVLTGLWTRFYSYIVAAFAAIAAISVIYFKGRKDANEDTERRVLQQDLEGRKISDAVRSDVAADTAVADRLRRWQRPGS